MGTAAVWAFILAILGLNQFDISVREVVARQGIFGTSYKVTGVACERWGGVVESNVLVTQSSLSKEF